jgi:hypothetical protein
LACLPESARGCHAPARSGRQALTAMRPAGGDDLAATLGRHAGAIAVAALANQLAGLVGSLHGPSPGPCLARRPRLPCGEKSASQACHAKRAARPKRLRRWRAYGGRAPPSQCRRRILRRCRRGACLPALALGGDIPDIAPGRLARDVSLANRVRSGRKQPQRDRTGLRPASHLAAARYVSSRGRVGHKPLTLAPQTAKPEP